MNKKIFHLVIYLLFPALLGCSGSSSTNSEKPSAPARLIAVAVSSSQINLSWTIPDSDAGIARYSITRNDNMTFSCSVNSYSDTGLSPDTEYSYTVTAIDSAGNRSAASNQAAATTQPETVDTEPPSAPSSLVATAVSSTRIDLSWTVSSDNVGIAGYTISRNDNMTFSCSANSYSNTGLSPDTEYTYTVTAIDSVGNRSAASNQAGAKTKKTTGSVSVLPVTADNSIIDNSSERTMNMGAATSIRLKSYQHHLILDADTSSIAGRKVVDATLRYARNVSELEHVTISSIQGDWAEGSSGGFSTREGASCFVAAEYHADTDAIVPWSFPGSRYVDVVYGNGNSLMGFSECPQSNGYYEWSVPADIVNAMSTGASYGIAVFESSHLVNRNPTVYSRESSNPPQLVVTTEAADPAPSAVADLTATTTGLDRGETRLSWTVPVNAFAYNLTITGGGYTNPTPVPRYLIPFAEAPGESQELILRDILEPGVTYTISFTAVARGGACSPAEEVEVIAGNIDSYPFETITISEPASNGSGISLGGLEVFAIPVTDKILPDGELSETLFPNYKIQNPVFDGNRISLCGGRNDMLAFLLVLKDTGSPQNNITINVDLTGLEADLDRVGFVNTDKGMVAELLRGPSSLYGTAMDENAGSDQHAQAVLVELYVPHETVAGTQNGTVDISGEFGTIQVPLDIRIEDFVIPDKPTFKCEMNDYGYPNYLATFNKLQTVARRFRSHVNLVPYSQKVRTRMDMYLPEGGQMDENAYNDFQAGDTSGYWDDFVNGFTPLFNAELYSSGPWSSAPVPGFYLTFHESWPLVAGDFYDEGTKDAYQAFPDSYGNTFKAILSDFVALAKNKSWDNAGFQVYLNNKPAGDHYTIGSGSSPWTLDEPVNFWDFRALGYYGRLFKEGAGDHSPVDIRYRIDISRYPYHRGQLDGLVDLAVVNRGLYTFRRLIFDIAKRDNVEIWNYGTANKIPDSNTGAAGWILSCYAMGGKGVLPWSTIKKGEEYLAGVTGNDRQQRALFVVTSDGQTPQVYPSLRLAAYRRGELDAEYLEILKKRGSYTNGQMERLIKNYLNLDTAFSVSNAYAEDAGTISFEDLTSTQLWQLRTHVIKSIVSL